MEFPATAAAAHVATDRPTTAILYQDWCDWLDCGKIRERKKKIQLGPWKKAAKFIHEWPLRHAAALKT